MTTPIPTGGQQLARFDTIDVALLRTAESETRTALRAIVQERMSQVLLGYDAAHDAEHGPLHMAREAARRLEPFALSSTNSWRVRVEAAALLLASLEVEAYEHVWIED